MRKLITAGVVSAVLVQNLWLPPAIAESKVADCFQLKYPSSSLNSSTLTLTADVYATCDSSSLGRGNGQKPVYSLVEQTDLNLFGCPGPAISPLAGNGFLGKVTCTIRVGDSPLASSRVGATFTTMKAWLAWDFSTRTLAINHSPIPGPTKSNSSGQVVPKASQAPAPAPAPTQTQYVEPPEVTRALKEMNDATEVVNTEVKIADEALENAIAAGERVAPLLQLIDQLLSELRERLNSWIEMLKRKRPDA